MQEFINTFSGIRFYPLEPRPEDVSIADIAHALSYMTRANGHLAHFYSVAQHSVNCALEAQARGHSRRIRLACLLHDASEAYLSDITRPLKHHLDNYLEIERRLQSVIYARYGLDLGREELAAVEAIDDALLYAEFSVIQGLALFDTEPALSLRHDFSERPFVEVRQEFLALFEELTNTI